MTAEDAQQSTAQTAKQIKISPLLKWTEEKVAAVRTIATTKALAALSIPQAANVLSILLAMHKVMTAQPHEASTDEAKKNPVESNPVQKKLAQVLAEAPKFQCSYLFRTQIPAVAAVTTSSQHLLLSV